MRTVLSIRSAAELAGVGEPAIRRAVREQRLDAPLVFYVGERHAPWICLDSLRSAYKVTAADIDRYEQWLASINTEPPIVVAHGTTWRLIDRGDVFHVVAK